MNLNRTEHNNPAITPRLVDLDLATFCRKKINEKCGNWRDFVSEHFGFVLKGALRSHREVVMQRCRPTKLRPPKVVSSSASSPPFQSKVSLRSGTQVSSFRRGM
jgi:hypothetical protein